MPQGDQAQRRHDPAGRAEFSRRARGRRPRARDGQRPHRPSRRDGGARRRRGAAEPAARPLAWMRINERDRRRRRAAARENRNLLPALTPLIVAAIAAPLDRLALDLRHADRRRPRDGHDDLHHGLGPDSGLRHDGRAQFRPRRLHRARRLCRDAGACCRWRPGRRPIRSPLNLAVFALALLAAASGLRRARLGVRARADRAGLWPAPEADPGDHRRLDRRRAIALRVVRPGADPAAAAGDLARLVRPRRRGDREIPPRRDGRRARRLRRRRCWCSTAPGSAC